MNHQSLQRVFRSASHADGHANETVLDAAPRVPIAPGREARYGLCSVAALIPNPHAVQVHPKRQIGKLARAMSVTGPLSPIIIDEGYMILAGHARVQAAKSLAESLVPVVQVFGLSDVQKRTFLLSDNRVGEDARLDRKALFEQLPALTPLFEEAGFVLTDTGYETAELDSLVLDLDGVPEPDEEDGVDPALLNEPVFLRRGDLLRCGDHRLIIGDARDAMVLQRLMAGDSAAAAFLDPPYNVRVSDIVGRGRVRHREFAFASGEMTRPEFVVFLQEALRAAAQVSLPSAIHFVCMDWKHVRDLIEAGESAYDAFLNLVVWKKTNAGQGGLYRSQHELIGVFRVGPEPHQDNVQHGRFGRNRSNVWTYAGVNSFRVNRLEDLAAHPTVKPTALVADALKDVTARDAVVLDSFVGSGTTILAGERIGRRVRAVEIDPAYAQIAARRWEAMTGRAATLEGTDMILDDLATHRAVETELPPTTPTGISSDHSTASPVRVRIRPPLA